MKNHLGERLVEVGVVQGGERGDADQRTLQLADVALDLRRDQFEDVVGNSDAVHLRLLAQNGDAGLEVGWLNVGDQAPLESCAEPIFKCRKLFRRSVGGNDDLLARIVQRVEGVEELFLDTFLADQELDVVDEQHVDVAVAALERDPTVVTQRVDEVVGEFLGGDVLDPHTREQSLGVVPCCVQQVRLAETGLTPDEQRVVGARRGFGDSDGRRVREAIRRSDHEGVEGVLGVEVGARRSGRRGWAFGEVRRPVGRSTPRLGPIGSSRRRSWRLLGAEGVGAELVDG